MKAKFGKMKVKRSDGFIDTKTIAYVDVTKTIKNIFKDVKRAVIIQDTYYGGDSLEEWKKSQREISAKIDDNGKRLEIDQKELIIELSDGKCVSFWTSEWGSLNLKDKWKIE